MSKPFLKWAGGKYKLVGFIAEHLPKNYVRKCLVEPFSGSAALSLALDFEYYILSDNNADVIGLFQVLKSEKEDFIKYARSFFILENNQKDRFYELRMRFNQVQDKFERAALFVYLNRHAFNGLCRYNKNNIFNAPFGRYKTIYFPEQEMRAFIQKSARMEFIHGDFETVFLNVSAEDIIYCDPPYVPLSASASFTAYSQNSFNLEDQKRLAACARLYAPYTQQILISNHDTALTRELYQGAEIKTLAVQRNISAQGKNRIKVNEILAVF